MSSDSYLLLTNPMHEIPSGFLVSLPCLLSLSLHSDIPPCQPISTSAGDLLSPAVVTAYSFNPAAFSYSVLQF